MGYHVVDPADLDPTPGHPCDQRSVAEAAGLAAMALSIYDLEPGEDLATGYHYHERREEAFYVLAGELRVETPEEEYAVGEGEFFAVEPESPIRPHNPPDANSRVRVLGVGVPKVDVGLPYEP